MKITSVSLTFLVQFDIYKVAEWQTLL